MWETEAYRGRVSTKWPLENGTTYSAVSLEQATIALTGVFFVAGGWVNAETALLFDLIRSH
jgi:hypothetical protein